MTYISAEVTKNRQHVIVWSRNQDGEREHQMFPAPYEFFYQDPDGEYLDIQGNALSKLSFKNSYEFREAREHFAASGIRLYESDIGPEYKILSRHFYNKPAGKLNITFFDIEVDKDDDKDYATIRNPYAPIISVAIYHQYNNRAVVYAVPPDNTWTYDKIPDELTQLGEVVLCRNERQLLKCFLIEIENTDVLSGYNSEFYDVPYLYMRLANTLGIEYARQLSFPNAREPEIREVEQYNELQLVVRLHGRVSLDYLALFKKLEPADRESYSLESVSGDLLPDLKKLEYEGALHHLYRNDFLFFLRYNIRDTEILRGLEEKLRYAEFAVSFSHLATGMIDNILTTVKLSDTTLINYCHYVLDRKVPDVNRNILKEKFDGAWVLDPVPGFYEMGSAVDVVSLYPSMIRALNISPETIVGQFIENGSAYSAILADQDTPLTLRLENGSTEVRTALQWKKYFVDSNFAISANGTIYDHNKEGFIPAILAEWFSKRKEYKRELKKVEKRIEALLAQYLDNRDPGAEKSILDNLALERDHYDRMQYVMKIRLNSIYGCLGNPHFRFFDVRNALSTTQSGREVLFHMVKQIAKGVDGQYQYPSPCIIYGDTDSCYFRTMTRTVEESEIVARNVTKDVNESFPSFLEKAFLCSADRQKIVNCEYEFIFDGSIFVKKKLYLLHLATIGGKAVDKMKIIGLSIKKTGLPKHVRVTLQGFIKELVQGGDWHTLGKKIVEYREQLLNETDVVKIGLPQGIKVLSEYTAKYKVDSNTDLPGHVAACIFWNQCLEQYKDNVSLKITSGFKIKKFYLTQKFGRFKSIAVPTDQKELPRWFIENFVPYIDRFGQVTRLIDMPLKGILEATGKIIPTHKTLLF
jgi:DNA polymerase elongation subunit (family B)